MIFILEIMLQKQPAAGGGTAKQDFFTIANIVNLNEKGSAWGKSLADKGK